MTLNKRLQQLKKLGCFPSIYKRGSLWRAHVNMSGNFWEDHEDPCQALEKAVALWKRKGCPLDGRADVPYLESGDKRGRVPNCKLKTQMQ